MKRVDCALNVQVKSGFKKTSNYENKQNLFIPLEGFS